MATNEEVAKALEELADHVQARGELIFKVRSYRRAAAAIRDLDIPLEEYVKQHRLREIPGVGEAIAKKVADMMRLGPAAWLRAYVARKSGETSGALLE